MKYEKPRVIAKNRPAGKYCAGCPVKDSGWSGQCARCERTR